MFMYVTAVYKNIMHKIYLPPQNAYENKNKLAKNCHPDSLNYLDFDSFGRYSFISCAKRIITTYFGIIEIIPRLIIYFDATILI